MSQLHIAAVLEQHRLEAEEKRKQIKIVVDNDTLSTKIEGFLQ
jgi:hypothetical protein